MKKGTQKKKHIRTSKKGKQFYAGRSFENIKHSKQIAVNFAPLKHEDYSHIADEVDLGYGHKEAYISFMLKRFPKEYGRSYAVTWAKRFKKGIHWDKADVESTKILKKVYGID